MDEFLQNSPPAGSIGRAKSRRSRKAAVTYALNDYDLQRYSRLAEIAGEIVQEHSQLDRADLADLYPPSRKATPRPRWTCAAPSSRTASCCWCASASDGGWTMPGGWADVGNVPSEAAEREVWEEAGFKVKADQGHRRLRCQPHRTARAVPRLQDRLPVRPAQRRGGDEQRDLARSPSSLGTRSPAKLSGERTRPATCAMPSSPMTTLPAPRCSIDDPSSA